MAVTSVLKNRIIVISKTRKLCYRKDDRAMRLIYECPESYWMCI